MANPTVQLLVKMVVSGVFVGLISEIAKRAPNIGGLIAALPVISFLTVFWLRVDGGTNTQIANLLQGILFGIIPTSLCLFVLMLLLRRDVPLTAALAVSVVVLAVSWFITRALVTA
jgi:hypothetical protein